MQTGTLIIGAGVAGLTLAHRLGAADQPFLILEKSERPGGRLATRTTPHGSADHGAQYLTAKTPAFQGVLATLEERGAATRWQPQGKDSPHDWWIGTPAMNAIGFALADNLPIQFGTEVKSIRRQKGSFVVTARRGDENLTVTAGQLVLAIPAPQVARLAGDCEASLEALRGTAMAPCLTGIAFFAPGTLPPLLTAQGIIRGKPGNPVSLMVVNRSRSGREDDAVVVHATPDWSMAHLEDDPHFVEQALRQSFRDMFKDGEMPEPVLFQMHRWRYALVTTPLGTPFFEGDPGFFACGDWCIEGRAEAAFLSANALADRLLRQR